MKWYIIAIIVLGVIFSFGLSIASYKEVKPEFKNKRLLIFLLGIFGGKYHTEKGQLRMILSVVVLGLMMLAYVFYVWSRGN